ncbi:MAG: NAD(P)-dependent alcohol dehydrogenase [Thermoplasmata archaeon]|nr:MAG: NAD(P)-dependent alcohol dehydrogenase [Thermoplasmata archaeon]
MKAVVWTKYGPLEVLKLQEVPKPSPKDNEVLIKVHAATVTAGDCEVRRFEIPIEYWLFARMMWGFRKPKRVRILGMELAGEIESVGREVTKFSVEDQVFGSTEMSLGAYAEYKCLPQDGCLTKIPANISYEEAACIPTGGLNALHYIRKGNIQEGQRVLIVGAGGSIGTIGVQLAKLDGAYVVAVDGTKKLDMLRNIGADEVIDYTKEDYTKSKETYDVIFDIVGKGTFSRHIGLLKNKGIYLMGNPRLPEKFRGRWTSMTSGRKVISSLASYKIENLDYLKELFEAGKLKSVIDRRYPLEQIVEAHRYVETGQKKGNVVIDIV